MACKIFFVLLMIHRISSEPTSCKTPKGGAGDCIPIFKCTSFSPVPWKGDNVNVPWDKIQKWTCGIDCGTSIKVCCPRCYTPESQPGVCKDIRLCQDYLKLLSQPLKTIKPYIESSKCESPAEYSVCCPINDKDIKYTAHCEPSEYPADPRTRCCGNQYQDRILGNTALYIDQEPWLALIEYKKDEVTTISCGGVLISSGYVLTAAHCVVGQKLDNGVPTNVRLGEFNITNEGRDCQVVEFNSLDCTEGAVVVSIKAIVPHPEYDPAYPFENDIALIKLTELAPYTDFIRPICLPVADVTEENLDIYRFKASGWGSAGKDSTTLQTKQTMELHYDKTLSLQNSSIGTKLYVTSNQNQKACKGDSGGPLTNERSATTEVIGIESCSNDCHRDSKPNVYTKVIRYKNWILNHIYNNN